MSLVCSAARATYYLVFICIILITRHTKALPVWWIWMKKILHSLRDDLPKERVPMGSTPQGHCTSVSFLFIPSLPVQIFLINLKNKCLPVWTLNQNPPPICHFLGVWFWAFWDRALVSYSGTSEHSCACVKKTPGVKEHVYTPNMEVFSVQTDLYRHVSCWVSHTVPCTCGLGELMQLCWWLISSFPAWNRKDKNN